MTKGTFGEHLKREREMRGVSLEEISAATRISTRFLEALENEQWERLPGGVFNRGFVRAVAHFLGLSEENLVAEYAMATDDKPQVAVWLDAAAPRPGRRTGIWVAAVLVGVGAAAWFAYRQAIPWMNAGREPVPAVPSSATAPVPAAVPAPSAPGVQPAALPEAAAPPSSTPLELKIEAGRPTALTVIADGKTVFEGRIEAGEQKMFQARQRFDVSAGNASALLLDLNGRTVPPLGPPGEPGRVTLTPSDLKKIPGGED